MGYFLINASSTNKDIVFGSIKIPGDIIDVLIKKCITVVIVIFLMFISIKIGNILISKFVKRQIENPNSRLTMSPQKAKTIGAVMHSILKYSVYFIGIAIILSDLFKGISLTFASIGGFAVGFGAQSLVQDLINGFFILFEDQYGVGDYVTIGTFEGIIDSIGIRTTILKDFNGDLHLIPNGTIKAVTNHSRNNMRFIVDVSIAYEEDIDHAIDIIDKTCKEFQGEHKEDVPQPIDIWGVTNLGASGVNIRIVGFSIPMKQWSMERNLRKAIKEALDKEGIEIPYNKTQIIMKEA
ncbi:mechanosensitive ion channel family protein [Clostridium sardiniense]|uniref:mechanosensitive ion channel family protein n=1 Tax=Clostridium sardiniense TaxID=29369 RepID=UPI00195D5E7B|nr:mechanosensitive ion channel family protein [Clostridium sardiniense]MBM7836405.1 small conductance mechanosensitive channel [Clostridium sardiniense]